MHFAECTNDTEKSKDNLADSRGRRTRGRKELIMAKRYPNNKSIQMSFLFIEAREQITGLYYRAQKKRLSV